MIVVQEITLKALYHIEILDEKVQANGFSSPGRPGVFRHDKLVCVPGSMKTAIQICNHLNEIGE